mgnify:CR=1 FL=1
MRFPAVRQKTWTMDGFPFQVNSLQFRILLQCSMFQCTIPLVEVLVVLLVVLLVIVLIDLVLVIVFSFLFAVFDCFWIFSD